jgi:hypothetical protein
MSTLAHPLAARPGPPPAGAETASAQVVLVARFVADGGSEWSAIGGGATLREAVAFARESCPAGARWRLAAWDHLHGA